MTPVTVAHVTANWSAGLFPPARLVKQGTAVGQPGNVDVGELREWTW